MSIPTVPGVPDLPAIPEVPALSGPPAGSGLCPTCGAPLPDGAHFCEVCGAPSDQAPPWRLGDAVGTAATAEVVAANAGAVAGAAEVVAAEVGAAEVGAADAAPCRACGGTVAADGYCETCGARGVSERDHVEEQPAPWLAGTCDRGIRHERNEDALALALLPDGAAVLVVCDGVSSSTDPDVASLAAATAARDFLAEPDSDPDPDPDSDLHSDLHSDTDPDPRGDEPKPHADQAQLLATRVREAVDAAQEAVVAATRDRRSSSPPSCTIVAAVLAPAPDLRPGTGLLALAWIGDSRAYWLPDDPGDPGPGDPGPGDPGPGDPGPGDPGPGDPENPNDRPSVLTLDDSVAAEQMALGMSREEADRGPHAHAITRWLGVDSPEGAAQTTTALLQGPGWLLVCTDGLWNYCSESADLAVLVAERSALLGDGPPEPLALSRALVDWAIERGGHDNITVALARIDGPADTSRGSARDG